jgi:hypothetical protein
LLAIAAATHYVLVINLRLGRLAALLRWANAQDISNALIADGARAACRAESHSKERRK